MSRRNSLLGSGALMGAPLFTEKPGAFREMLARQERATKRQAPKQEAGEADPQRE